MRAVSLVAAALTTLLVAQTAPGDWSQFQGNAGHTGYVPGSIDAPRLTKIWSVAAPSFEGSAGDRAVAIADGKVYATVLDGNSFSGPYLVKRLNGADGSLDWQTSIPGHSLSGVSAPAVANGTVYLHHWGHSSSSPSKPEEFPALVGLDAETGNQRFWTTHSGQSNSGSRPTVAGDRVYAAGGYYGGLDSYRADGTHQWYSYVNQQYGWIPAADERFVYVYMGEASASPGPEVGSLFVVDRADGSRRATILHPASASRALQQRQTVMLGGGGDAFALTEDSIGDAGHQVLVCFDIDGRRIKWERLGSFFGNPAVADGVIVILDGNELRFLDQETGDSLGTWDAGVSLGGNVVLTDSHAFVSSSDAVFAVDLRSRQLAWSFAGLAGALAFDDGLLVVGNSSGIHAFAVVPEPTGLCGLLCALMLPRRRRRRASSSC